MNLLQEALQTTPQKAGNAVKLVLDEKVPLDAVPSANGPQTLPRNDAATAHTMREMVAKGAMPPLVLVVDDCRAAYDKLRAKGVEFIQEPIARFGGVDANFRDPSGNAWKMIEARS